MRLEPGPADRSFVSAFGGLSHANPDVVAWACHGRLNLAPRSSGFHGVVQRTMHTLSPMTLHGGVFASDGRALEVLGRHQWLVRGRTPDYSKSRLVVPFSSLERLEVSGHLVYEEATVVTMTAGETTVELVVPIGSEAERILSAVARVASIG